MLIDKSLLIKGIAGVAAVGTIGGVGAVYKEEIGDLFKSKEQIERKRVNGILGSLGIEKEECKLGDNENPSSISKECTLGDEDLDKIRFSNKGRGDLKIVGDIPNNLKLKIEGTKEDITFSFLNIPDSSPIKLFGEKGLISLKSTPETKFKVKDGILTRDSKTVDETLKGFNEQLEKVKAPVECRFDEAESETTVECDVTSDDLKKMEFSNRGKGDLKVKDWPSSGAVKLKVEKGDQNTMSISFTGVTSDIKVIGGKGKIVIKKSNGSNKKFKVVNDKLTKDSTGVNSELKTKLEEFNKQLGSVNAPQECRFDEIEGETTVECDVASDELKKMVFSKNQGALTYSSGTSDFTGMKLVLKTHQEMKHSGTGNTDWVMYLTFKDFNKTVKLLKGGKEFVSLVKGTNPEFGIYKENDESEVLVVEKMWDLGYISTTLGIQNCTIPDGQTKGQCNFNSIVKTIKVLKETGNDFEELTMDDINGRKLELEKDVQDFNQGYKFVFKGKTVSGTNGSISLEENCEYEFKWKLQSNTKISYLVKKTH